MSTRISFWLLLVLMFVSGCTDRQKVSSDSNLANVRGTNGQFPEFLVGKWKAADANLYKWGFAFEKDGTVSAMRNFLDMYIEVAEGGAYEQAPDANVDKASTLGPVEAGFDPNGQILTVKVVTTYFMLHAYDQTIEGNSVDTFAGPVSQDGLIWNAEWRSLSQLVNGSPIDLNDPSVNSVIFYKLKEGSRSSK